MMMRPRRPSAFGPHRIQSVGSWKHPMQLRAPLKQHRLSFEHLILVNAHFRTSFETVWLALSVHVVFDLTTDRAPP